eukprot:gene14031-13822_t
MKWLAGAVMLGAVAMASASPADPKNGVEYRTLAQQQPVEAGKKIEVLEFFDYACPHCHAFDPDLTAWVKKQGDNIVFKRMHISRQGTDLPQEKMYFTLIAMGLLNDAMHSKIFQEMHVNRNRMNRDELVFDFIAKQGIDKQKFIDTYRGFGVAGSVRRSISMMDAYTVDSWPLIAIDGKYITSPTMANEGSKSASSEAQLHAQAMTIRGAAPDRVFITGASSGIGAALAAEYAAQGATLGLLARRSAVLDQLIASLPNPERHRAYAVDVRDHAAIAAAAQDFLAHAGGIDVVVANAGISVGTLTEFSEDIPVFEAVIATNVVATAATFAPFIPAMKMRSLSILASILSDTAS